jgi:hypothetical protein
MEMSNTTSGIIESFPIRRRGLLVSAIAAIFLTGFAFSAEATVAADAGRDVRLLTITCRGGKEIRFLIKPGDRVDVFHWGAGKPTTPLLENMLVVAVDKREFPPEDKAGFHDTWFTLEVKGPEAKQKILAALKTGGWLGIAPIERTKK